MSITRRAAIAIAAAAALLGACQQASNAASAGQGRYERPGDMAIGNPNAAVTVIEYASATCAACAAWHDQVYPTIKERYIDTGRIRFVFREFPTNPAQVAVAGFQVARCGGATPEQYFARMDVIFEQQMTILEAAARGQARQALLDVARSAGLSEDQFNQCVRDPSAAQRIQDSIDFATKTYDVTGTPTIIINDEKLENPTLANLTAALDRRLAQ